MNVPLSWLATYVELPKDLTKLTDRLTMIGHMLDKVTTVNRETIIDLELRGNRSDLFGLIGIARDIHAAFDTSFTLPNVATLPSVAPDSRLITCTCPDLVDRITGLTLQVTVGKSPNWLVKHLAAYGLPSINSVVDITNYVMIETGEPMHAFDLTKLKGGRIIARTAKPHEVLTTLLGTKLTLTSDDIVLADERQVQGTAIIGSKTSEVDAQTTHILLEAAVYNQANVRRTARRHGIRTEAGTRHEKHLDPHQIPFALARAIQLLVTHAGATITSQLCDVYPLPSKPLHISLPLSEIERLTAVSVPIQSAKKILESLGCTVAITNDILQTTVPTYRTDIKETADLVEEIIRIWGYEKIPTTTLSGETPLL